MLYALVRRLPVGRSNSAPYHTPLSLSHSLSQGRVCAFGQFVELCPPPRLDGNSGARAASVNHHCLEMACSELDIFLCPRRCVCVLSFSGYTLLCRNACGCGFTNHLSETLKMWLVCVTTPLVKYASYYTT